MNACLICPLGVGKPLVVQRWMLTYYNVRDFLCSDKQKALTCGFNSKGHLGCWKELEPLYWLAQTG